MLHALEVTHLKVIGEVFQVSNNVLFCPHKHMTLSTSG